MDVDEHDTVLPAWLVTAYRATRYAVHAQPAFALQIDVPSPELDALMDRGGHESAAYITAWNPLGVDLPQAESAARQACLMHELNARGRRWVEGFGAHPYDHGQGEPSLLVLGVNRVTACDLGRRHGQNALLWVGADAVPHLLLLR